MIGLLGGLLLYLGFFAVVTGVPWELPYVHDGSGRTFHYPGGRGEGIARIVGGCALMLAAAFGPWLLKQPHNPRMKAERAKSSEGDAGETE
jgi:hypothetical protein